MKGHPTTFSHTTLSDIGINTHAQIDAYIAAGESRILVAQIRNQTGTTLTKGTVIYLSGVSGNKPLAVRAQANSEATSSGTFGVVQNDILTNQNGFAVCAGSLEGFNTSTFAEGAVLWLSPTVAGGFTTTKPQAPNHAVYLGVVTRSHATQGSVEIRVVNGYELEELHNVLIVNPLNKQVIAYDSVDSLYKNITLTKADFGLSNVDNTSDVNKPISATTQAALDTKVNSNAPISGNTKTKITYDSKGLVTGGADAGIADITGLQTSLNAKENLANKDQPSGYAGLDGSGKINPAQLPAIAVTDTNVVASQSAMLALTAEVGDLAVRTDLNKTFILRVSPASTLGNWQELLTPTDSVTSVYGRTGAVTSQSGDYTADQITETASNKILTSAERTKLSGIATGATANSTDAQLRDRTTHTGTQAISTVTNLQSTLDLKLEAASIANFETTTQLNSRDTANRNRANHTGTQLASTISDFASTVLATVLTGLSVATSSVIAATDTVLVALGKLQAQITTLGTGKQDTLVSGTNIKTVNTQSILGSGNITIGGSAAWGGITGTLSTQTDLQTALDGKQAAGDYATNTALTNGLSTKENTITAGTTAQYFRGDKTFQTLNKNAVGLSNVDNTSDVNKPISTQQMEEAKRISFIRL